MKTFLAIILGCVLGLAVSYGSNQTTDGSFSDFSTKVALVNAGETLTVSACNVDWAANTITITKAINIMGAGIGQSIITADNGADGSATITIAPTTNIRFQVDGLELRKDTQVGSNTGSHLKIIGSGQSGGSVGLTEVLVSNCKFVNGTRQLYVQGYCYGVGWNLESVNPNIFFSPRGDNTTAWSRPIQPGTEYAFYIEDYTVTYDSGASAGEQETFYCFEGARAVIRHGTTTSTAYSGNFYWFDSHGNYPSSGPVDPDSPQAIAQRGQPWVEFYSNTLAANVLNRGGNIRGGAGVWYSNVITRSSGVSTNSTLTEEEGWQTVLFSPLLSAKPAHDPIANWFFYSNTIQGVSNNTVVNNDHSSDNTIFVIQNTDYFLRAMQTGDTYYPYTALAYPHPFRDASSGNGGVVVSGKVTLGGKVSITP